MKLYSTSASRFLHTGLDLPSVPIHDRMLWGRYWDQPHDDPPTVEDIKFGVGEATGLVCINVEHWRVDPYYARVYGPDAWLSNVNRYVTLLRRVRQACPDAVIGMYMLPIFREWWPVVRQDDTALKEWREAVRSLAPIAAQLHVNMPSLYTFYEMSRHRIQDWTDYAEANIDMAEEEYPKPTIPFIWPRYHDAGPKPLQAISYGGWKHQLDTLASMGCEAAIIWDAEGYFSKTHGAESWTEKTPWVQATKDFLAEQAL